jgi:hypothetical protein
MTLTIELTPAERMRLEAAAEREGVQPATLVRRILTSQLPALAEGEPQTDPMLALFAEWEEEDLRLTPEQVSNEIREWELFKAHTNAERARAGARPVF